MKRAICFGASGGAKRLWREITEKYEIVAFTDNDERKWGSTVQGIPVVSVSECMAIDFDIVVITSAPGMESIKEQLAEMGISPDRIDVSFVETPLISRRIFLQRLSFLQHMQKREGDVAEAGVFEGDFARSINEYYPDKTLHLFDTFEGFAEKDVAKDTAFSFAKAGDYANTSVRLVMSKMPNPEQVRVHKGYFPDTTKELSGKERFCFVNLDMDLYEPTYNGLLYFTARMSAGGVILIHDYFADNFKGPKEAVHRFLKENQGSHQIFPIGDGISVMLVKSEGV